MKNNLKIFIQSNHKQSVAAKVAEYSFRLQGFKNIEILNLFENEILKKNFGKKYKRNGKIVSFDPDNLQSFTLLRFLPPKICNSKYCLVVDPDVFAVKNFENFLNIEEDNEKKLFCTRKNNKIRSEVMLINCQNFNLWNFDKVIEELFSLNMDYTKLINLEFINKDQIGLIEENFNSHDYIDDETILLHTTNRITQPWKIGLDIDFTYHISRSNLILNYLKKYLGLSYQKKILEKKYQKHPSDDVVKFVTKLFEEAIKSKVISEQEINYSLDKKYISEKFYRNLCLK